MAERTPIRQALSTVVDMIVAIQAIYQAGRAEAEDPGLFDAILARVEKQENAVCPIFHGDMAQEARHG